MEFFDIKFDESFLAGGKVYRDAQGNTMGVQLCNTQQNDTIDVKPIVLEPTPLKKAGNVKVETKEINRPTGFQR